ncbi:uncharacterized protein [Rutidosis leptorrhynchoides]|uniref:uncharacterized protein n=1 Tax=Rutidosis leptorrhynchoides TaxID=125765 RepID=UPI003A9A64CE
MDPHHLQQSLLTTTITAATTDYDVRERTPLALTSSHSTKTNVPSIIFRVFLISFVGIVSIWANHEASKGFSITIVNDAGKYSSSGKRFSIFYDSNDKATRILLNTSIFVEKVLYPNQEIQHNKKQIKGVTLRLASTNIPSIVSVHSPKPHEYVINLSPSLMETSNNNELVVLAILQGLTRVWLWNGNGETPSVLMNGIVEYISNLAGFKSSDLSTFSENDSILREYNGICWKDVDQRKVAGFFRYVDQSKPPIGGGGEVIRRLNILMKSGWHDSMVDDALGMDGHHACASYGLMIRHHHQSSSL